MDIFANLWQDGATMASYYDESGGARPRIPGTIRGVGARERMRSNAADAASRQDNWSKHFGGPNSTQLAEQAEVKARVAVMQKNQNVENMFKAQNGMPVTSGTGTTGTTSTTPNPPTASTGTTTSTPTTSAKETIKKAAVPAAPAAPPLAAGVQSRDSQGNTKFYNGDSITATGAKRVLSSKFGTGSATDRAAAPSNDGPPGLTPTTLAVNAIRKIPAVGSVVDRIRGAIGGRKVSAPTGGAAPETPAAPAQPARPAGATPTKSGGYMSISGKPVEQPAAPQLTEMQKREATYKQQQRDKIYPELSAKHTMQRNQNAALVKKHLDAAGEFDRTASPAVKKQADVLTHKALVARMDPRVRLGLVR